MDLTTGLFAIVAKLSNELDVEESKIINIVHEVIKLSKRQNH